MKAQETKSGAEVAQTNGADKSKAPVGKTHADYWRQRLFKRGYVDRGGASVEIPDWQVRIAHLGRRQEFNLKTANKSDAAVKARDIYLSLIASGWAATMAKEKPEMERPSDVCTVGEFVEAVKASGELREVTFEIYCTKFRTLVSGAMGISAGVKKFDYVKGGREEWLDRVHAFKLDRVTPDRVSSWKTAYLKAAEAKDPVAHARAKTTVDSILRGTRSLFLPKILEKLDVKLPKVLPLDGVRLEKTERPDRSRLRYQSRIEPGKLFRAARRDLEESEPEAFKIFILSLFAGLRRDEIDALTWKAINWNRGKIQIATTEHAQLKTTTSHGEVAVAKGVLAILKKHQRNASSEFVIESDIEKRPQGTYHHYRADRHFSKLIEWLRENGVNAESPIHTLRKEFGANIVTQAGIFAASKALRHTSIQMTAAVYADQKHDVVFELPKGAL